MHAMPLSQRHKSPSSLAGMSPHVVPSALTDYEFAEVDRSLRIGRVGPPPERAEGWGAEKHSTNVGTEFKQRNGGSVKPMQIGNELRLRSTIFSDPKSSFFPGVVPVIF